MTPPPLISNPSTPALLAAAVPGGDAGGVVLTSDTPPTSSGAIIAPTDGAAGVPSPMAPGDFQLYRQTTLTSTATGGQNTYSEGEPSVGNIGRVSFETGNTYASVSGDNGSFFGFVDPRQFSTAGDFAGGVCCDQRVANDPVHGMTMWSMQYWPTGSGTAKTDGVRIIAYKNATDLLNNNWTSYSFTPRSFNLPAGDWIDFPHLETSSGNLYYTGNVYNSSDNYVESIIWPVSLDQIAAGGNFNYTWWIITDGESLAPTDNAGTTMYFGSVSGSNSVRVYSVADANTSLTDSNVTGLVTTNFATHTSLAPNGVNWTQRDDGRMMTAWQTGGTIGFMWDSAQGTNRPQPFVRALRLNTSNLSVVDQPDIWSTGNAWAYPGISVDARGHIAGVVTIGGPSNYPQVNALINDDFSPSLSSSGWENSASTPAPTPTAAGATTRTPIATASSVTPGWAPDSPRTGRPSSPITTGSAAAGTLPPSSPRSGTWATPSGLENSFVGPSTGSNSFINPIWNSAFGTRDVDFYKFQATAGSTVTLVTSLPTNGSAMDTILRLFDASGSQLALNDDDPNGGTVYSRISYVVPATGTYYVGVSGYNNRAYNPTAGGSGVNGGFGDYQLSINLTAPADIGDTIATSTATGLSGATGSYAVDSTIGNGSFPTRDVDMLRIDAAAGSVITAVTSATFGRDGHGHDPSAFRRLGFPGRPQRRRPQRRYGLLPNQLHGPGDRDLLPGRLRLRQPPVQPDHRGEWHRRRYRRLPPDRGSRSVDRRRRQHRLDRHRALDTGRRPGLPQRRPLHRRRHRHNYTDWVFTVTPGSYHVAATWFAFSNRATNAPYSVYDGTTLVGTVPVNQQVTPADFTDRGSGWKDLRRFTVASTTLRVRLTDAANGFVISDAIRIVPSATGNQPPVIASLAAVRPGDRRRTLTLTAGGVSDPDGTVASVAFYRESNGTPGCRPSPAATPRSAPTARARGATGRPPYRPPAWPRARTPTMPRRPTTGAPPAPPPPPPTRCRERPGRVDHRRRRRRLDRHAGPWTLSAGQGFLSDVHYIAAGTATTPTGSSPYPGLLPRLGHLVRLQPTAPPTPPTRSSTARPWWARCRSTSRLPPTTSPTRGPAGRTWARTPSPAPR